MDEGSTAPAAGSACRARRARTGSHQAEGEQLLSRFSQGAVTGAESTPPANGIPQQPAAG